MKKKQGLRPTTQPPTLIYRYIVQSTNKNQPATNIDYVADATLDDDIDVVATAPDVDVGFDVGFGVDSGVGFGVGFGVGLFLDN